MFPALKTRNVKSGSEGFNDLDSSDPEAVLTTGEDKTQELSDNFVTEPLSPVQSEPVGDPATGLGSFTAGEIN